ncbi:Fc receptor-like protein 5 [Sebastes fasciatus]|uniref:Fc receptor-like protein 5 n=1 Tax=Sebastes fasciatus TaxID=394691 RepID=UPI003D9F02D2
MSDGSSYTCKFDEDEESDSIKLKPKPKAQLSADRRDILAGGNVTLTCSVRPSSSGWKYFWYRGNKTSEPLTTQDDDLLSNGQIRVSQRGLYRCRGGRGDPVYYTEYSDPVVTNRAVVIPQPNWPEIYSGETITLTCEIKDGGDAEWEYEWLTPNSNTPRNPSEHMIRSSHGGDYSCKGTMKSEKSSTEWSNPLRVSSNSPQSVLTVSPLWLSPGDSVTLNCNVTHPSAGWRFYWYKAVLKPAGYSYSYELLPGSTSGTEQDSYIVHGQTHTAGYYCRAGRGDPVFHSDYSEPKFVWSGDVHSAASLTVSPDRAQHFDKQSVSLSCEGNSTKWRVMWFSGSGYLNSCTSWGTMTGSTCNIDRSWHSGVYWCESETGQFSNAVNITIQYFDTILVSPVHPVAEGHPVTLGCKLKTEKVLHDVDFYKNDKLIKNHTNGELIITAVSKSDEGFYKCKGKESPEGRWSWTSQESWMSVKHVPVSEPEKSSPFPVLLIVGLVCGVLLIILLLLFLYCYRKSNDSCFKRSQSTNQGPATDHMINQDEAQSRVYASLLHGPARLYETIKGAAEPENDESGDVTYSVVELKNIAKKGKNEPEESTVYSDVKMASAADDNVMYAQVHSHTKVKKDKGKSSPAEAEEAVYSEVKPGTARDQ